MILIADEIITKLKSSTFTIPNVNIRDFYDARGLQCPQISINELPSNEGIYNQGQPKYVTNIFTIECYAKDMIVNSVPMNKKQVAMKLILEVDKILNETYGLTMKGNVQAMPYEDITIFRAVATYVAYIDKDTQIIYRNL